jgi:hypothetical protein
MQSSEIEPPSNDKLVQFECDNSPGLFSEKKKEFRCSRLRELMAT